MFSKDQDNMTKFDKLKLLLINVVLFTSYKIITRTSLYRKENFNFNTTINISSIKLRIWERGKINFVNIEKSPHYFLVAGLNENNMDFIEIYTNYFNRYFSEYNVWDKIAVVKALIDEYKNNNADFIIDLRLNIFSLKHFLNYLVLDGNHRVAILRYYGVKKVRSNLL